MNKQYTRSAAQIAASQAFWAGYGNKSLPLEKAMQVHNEWMEDNGEYLASISLPEPSKQEQVMSGEVKHVKKAINDLREHLHWNVFPRQLHPERQEILDLIDIIEETALTHPSPAPQQKVNRLDRESIEGIVLHALKGQIEDVNTGLKIAKKIADTLLIFLPPQQEQVMSGRGKLHSFLVEAFSAGGNVISLETSEWFEKNYKRFLSPAPQQEVSTPEVDKVPPFGKRNTSTEYIDRAITLLKDMVKDEWLVAGYNGVVSLLAEAKIANQEQEQRIKELEAQPSPTVQEPSTEQADSRNQWVKHFNPPFKHAEDSTFILDSHGNIVIEVRGWGHLSNLMTDIKACEVQDQIANHITDILNSSTEHKKEGGGQ
jgi:hypothetical protein